MSGRLDPHAFRPEIQGLRAVAVALVVVFHLWPGGLRGGYVGVDVFFVVSGYLITAHLLREVLETGGLKVTRFWARRIRRLLPASLLVLAVSAVGVVTLAPSTTWHASGRQIAASALYVQNWVLAGDAVDYLAQDESPTVAQHYWSLSVEEQLYAFWPLLLLLAMALHRRLLHRVRRPDGATETATRRAVALGLTALCAASLGWSVWSVGQDQAVAYLSTLTRVWEFGAGALAATLVVRRTGWWSPVLGWAGLAAVVTAGALFTESSPFPGWIALLPVLGTVAVLRAGSGGRLTPGWWLSRRPMGFLGDISYSVYLVHWPLIVLAPSYLHHAPTTAEKVVLVGLTVALAWLSKTFVEDPLRAGRVLQAAPWRPFAFAVAGMAALVLANVGLQGVLDHRQSVAATRTAARLALAPSCLGPGALADPVRCGGVAGDGALVTPADVVTAQGRQWLVSTCQQGADTLRPTNCHVGDTNRPRVRVALVGDSHATHWAPLLEQLGTEHGWDVQVLTKSACPATDASRHLATETSPDRRERCDQFNDEVDRLLLDDPTVTDVFTSAFFSAYTWSARSGHPLGDPAVDGFGQRWARWAAAGKRVHVLADVPLTRGEAVPTCLARHPRQPLACAVPRRAALPRDVTVVAARMLHDPHVQVIDLTAQLCDATRCYARIGDVITYRDKTHLSFEYSRLLAPYLARRLGAPLV